MKIAELRRILQRYEIAGKGDHDVVIYGEADETPVCLDIVNCQSAIKISDNTMADEDMLEIINIDTVGRDKLTKVADVLVIYTQLSINSPLPSYEEKPMNTTTIEEQKMLDSLCETLCGEALVGNAGRIEGVAYLPDHSVVLVNKEGVRFAVTLKREAL